MSIKRVQFIRTQRVDDNGNPFFLIFTTQDHVGFENGWIKHEWLKKHFGKEVSQVSQEFWELLKVDNIVMVLEERDGMYREKDVSSWYDCARCDAGYPNQECTCDE